MTNDWATKEESHRYPTYIESKGRRLVVWWEQNENGEIAFTEQDLGPVPPPPPPLTPEETAERIELRNRMDAFLRDLDVITRKHKLALGNSCGIYPVDDEPGHYSVSEGFLGGNMLGERWVGIDVTWNEGEPDGERVEMRDDDDYNR